MKKLLFLALVIASVTTPSFSQESFIELVVKDTMMLQPKAWLYTVTITPDYSATVASMDTAYMATKAKNSSVKRVFPQAAKRSVIDEVAMLATTHGGRPNNDDGMGLTITKRSDFNTQSAGFLFTNLDSLKQFVKALPTIKEADGRISRIFPTESEPAMTALDSRIVATAKQRAENLAVVSGRQLGGVLLITEDTNKGNNVYETFLENIFRFDLMGKGDGNWALLNNQITVTRSLKVRFALR